MHALYFLDLLFPSDNHHAATSADLMEKGTKIPMDTPSYHLGSTRSGGQGYSHINRHRSMLFPLPSANSQVNYPVPRYFYCEYGRQQNLPPCSFPHYQRSYSQFGYSSPHQLPCPRASSYGQLCNNQFYNPHFGYLVGFDQNLQESVGQGDKRLATVKRSAQPPGGVIKEGQFFFSNKIYVQLSLEQQIRLGAVNPGTQNKCRKIRPWLVLWKLDNGNVIVV